MINDTPNKLKEDNPNRLLTREEAAEYMGIKKSTLATWTCNKRYNLPIVKVGRLVRYRLSDIIYFLEQRTIEYPTANEV